MPGMSADALLQQRGDALVVLAVASLHLHIDLRGHAEVQHLRDQIGGLEIEQHVRERRRKALRAAS